MSAPHGLPDGPSGRGSDDSASGEPGDADAGNGEHAAARAFRPHHRLTLLKGGEALFPAMCEAIAAARSEVLLETYIFDFAHSALAVAQALLDAAARGVAVRVVVDGVGTGDVPPDWQQRWQLAGVQWRVFNPARGWRLLLPKRWRRLHRKLCVIDGATGFCGGVNLLDDHFDPNYGTLEQPRFDFAVRVSGPLVADMRDTMMRVWARLQVTREARQYDAAAAVRAVLDAARAGTDMHDVGIKGRSRGPRRDGGAGAAPGAPGEGRGAMAALVLRDNLRFRRRIEGNYRLAIALARSEILIANAYFVPGVRFQRALIRAAQRGVRVTLLLQGRYEYFMQYHASRAVYRVLLDAGVQIIEHEASFLHAKVAVMDAEGGAMATVGSSNLDPLSLLLAREANVFVRDDAFAAELRGHLLSAIAHGRRIAPDDHAARSFGTRALDALAYTMMRVALFVTGKRY